MATADTASATSSSASRELVRARLAPGLVRTALAAVQTDVAPARRPTDSTRSSRDSDLQSRQQNGRAGPSSRVELSPQARQQIARLQATDAAVRAHEAAHMAVGGGLTSGATYSWTTGPDGKRYAVGGEVSIDTSRSDSPAENIERAARIRRAALAPASPSPQDLAVAASATRMEQQARQELAAQQRAEQRRQQQDGADGRDWLTRAYRSDTPGRGALLDIRA